MTRLCEREKLKVVEWNAINSRSVVAISVSMHLARKKKLQIQDLMASGGRGLVRTPDDSPTLPPPPPRLNPPRPIHFQGKLMYGEGIPKLLSFEKYKIKDIWKLIPTLLKRDDKFYFHASTRSI